MAYSPIDASLNLHREEGEDEVLRLRDAIGQYDAYNQDRRRTAFNPPPTENMLLHDCYKKSESYA